MQRPRIYLRIQIFVVVLALRRELNILASGLGVFENFSFVISNHDLFVVVIQNVTGINRHFAPAAGSVDYELWHRITSGMTAQALDNLDALCHRGPQV